MSSVKKLITTLRPPAQKVVEKALYDFFWGGESYQQCPKTKTVYKKDMVPTRPGNWVGINKKAK